MRMKQAHLEPLLKSYIVHVIRSHEGDGEVIDGARKVIEKVVSEEGRG